MFIAFLSVGGCGGAVVIVSHPAPPLDSDFTGGVVIVAAEGTSKIAGITSNGHEVVVVIEDDDEGLLGLVGLAISRTECEIMMFTKEPTEGFYEANGKCRFEDDGSVFKLEQVEYAGTTLELTGQLEDEGSLESKDTIVDMSPRDVSDDMLDFQEDIVEILN